ncbi:SHOCT domain-containing protein [Azospirillum argentinense]|uniref:SHOCT domain-containing protein n=1 Tax=Azospirillum brasilense TaxID=192 RepID=A0A4D8QGI5_AZOBR|nr:SHOCT domain-containing protein [Azospirillum argentinense]QCO07330.1 SHOCT domain-containing protein [Azospirillum argentinense]
MRKLILITRLAASMVLVLLGACQTTKSHIDASEAMEKFPADCRMRAQINGPVDIINDPGRVSSSGINAYAVKQVSADEQRAIACFCGNNFDLGKATESIALEIMKQSNRGDEWVMTSHNFYADNNRKILEYGGRSDSAFGKFNVLGKMYMENKCLQLFQAMARPGDNSVLVPFINSIYDPRVGELQSPKPNPQTKPTTSAPTNTATRLSTLKDMFERKVITKEEYEDRRRKILDHL